MDVRALLEPTPMARIEREDQERLFFSHGNLRGLHDIRAAIDQSDPEAKLSALLHNEPGSFSVAIVTEDRIFFANDRMASSPWYFSHRGDEFIFSNRVDSLLQEVHEHQICWKSVAEYLLSGYVHHERTLYKDIYCLGVGAFVLVEKTRGTWKRVEYFRYKPKPLSPEKRPATLSKELDDHINSAIQTTIEFAAGRPIIVPLSGGLDSRLILAKLKQHKYKELFSFTYGLSGNHESLLAKWVAEQLGVPWIFIRSKTRGLKELYKSSSRVDYANFSDGRQIVPSYSEFEAFLSIAQQNTFPSESVVVNGQSGDFLFGGHIPPPWLIKCSPSTVTNYILSRHCSHWNLPYLEKRQKEIGSQLMQDLAKQINTDDPSAATKTDLISFYEGWEYRERQPKVPVSNQRLYEYFRFAWNLPLWDARLIDFWSAVPFEQKVNQTLHINYLKKYNFKGVFDYGRSPQFAFTGPHSINIVLANLVGAFGGPDLKQQFYERMFYYTYFHPQLGLFGKEVYRHLYKDTRRPRVVPIAARFRLDELSILGLPQHLLPYV